MAFLSRDTRVYRTCVKNILRTVPTREPCSSACGIHIRINFSLTCDLNRIQGIYIEERNLYHLMPATWNVMTDSFYFHCYLTPEINKFYFKFKS